MRSQLWCSDLQWNHQWYTCKLTCIPCNGTLEFFSANSWRSSENQSDKFCLSPSQTHARRWSFIIDQCHLRTPCESLLSSSSSFLGSLSIPSQLLIKNLWIFEWSIGIFICKLQRNLPTMSWAHFPQIWRFQCNRQFETRHNSQQVHIRFLWYSYRSKLPLDERQAWHTLLFSIHLTR